MNTLRSSNQLVIENLNQALIDMPNKKYLLGKPSVTYATLASKIRQLSSFFKSADKAAIWMPKSNDYATLILATLVHGKTYIPLDGAQPASRASLIINDSECEILFTSHKHYIALCAEGLPSSLKKIIVIDEGSPQELLDAEKLVFRDAESYDPFPELELNNNLDSIAAILYTSGSTGVPKGVRLSYRNLENFIAWSQSELKLNNQDTLLNTANFNFDLSTFDLFLSLRINGSLYITKDGEQNNLARLSTILNDFNISCIYTVPTLLKLMNRVDMWSRDGAKSIKNIIFAGEVMPIDALKHMAESLDQSVNFYNFYGPTETNVCTYHKVTDADLNKDAPLPIGKPIGETNIEIRNDQGLAISKDSNAIGEIWVNGHCVTPGYVNRPEDRNSINHIMCWHATGDLGSYEGESIIYRGRIDRMVKINGYRIELGEIEATLLSSKDIREAAVIVNDKPEKTIKAYVVIEDEGHSLVTPLVLKQYCSSHLPSYMVPHKFSIKETLDKNANGKVDYRTLVEEV